MTPTETAAILRQFNEWRRGDEDIPQPDPHEIGEAIDAAIAMIERLEAAEKSDAESIAMYRKARDERDALRAKIEAMEKQEPVAWSATDETGTVVEALGMNRSSRFDTALYLAPGAQPAQKAVAYLDLGVGGYMDLGTDLTDEQLASLPKGRHILGIVGTYGVDGYVSAQPAPSIPEGWKLVPIVSTAEMDNAGADHVDGYWDTAQAVWDAMLATAPEAKP